MDFLWLKFAIQRIYLKFRHLFKASHYFCDILFAHQPPPLVRKERLDSASVYPRGVISYNINDVLDKQKDRPAEPTTTVPKKEAFKRLMMKHDFA